MSDTLVTKNILASTTKFPVLRGMKLTMEVWLKYPLRIIVADFEYMSGTGLPPLPIQVAIREQMHLASELFLLPRSTMKFPNESSSNWGGGG
jgi:hypothetical protein